MVGDGGWEGGGVWRWVVGDGGGRVVVGGGGGCTVEVGGGWVMGRQCGWIVLAVGGAHVGEDGMCCHAYHGVQMRAERSIM